MCQAKKKEKRKNAAAKEAAVVETSKIRNGIKASGQVGVAASGGDKPDTPGSEARLKEVRWVVIGSFLLFPFNVLTFLILSFLFSCFCSFLFMF